MPIHRRPTVVNHPPAPGKIANRRGRWLAAALALGLSASPSLATTRPVIHVGANQERLVVAGLAITPSGDAIVLGQSGRTLLYATRVHSRWRPARALPRLQIAGAAVSARQRGERWLLSWVAKGSTRGSRVITFADFRSPRTAPRLSRIFTRRLALDPVAIPGAGPGARAAWSVLDAPQGVLEGATDPAGFWRTAAALAAPITTPYSLAVAASPRSERLVALVRMTGTTGESVGFAQAGPRSILPALGDLYVPAADSFVTQLAPVFRARGTGAAVLVETITDTRHTAIDAVSVSGAAVAAPRTVVSGQRVQFTAPPQVASLPDGRLVAAWRRISPPHVQVMASVERTVGGEWAAPVVVSGAVSRAGGPSLVVTAAGQPVVAWSDGTRVLARILRADGSRLVKPAFALSPTGRGCREPLIAASGRRTLTAAYVCQAGRSLQVTSRPLPAS